MTPALPLLIEPRDLAAHLGHPGLLLVDLSKPQIYAQAHLPGAISVDFKRLQRGHGPEAGLLPEKAALEALLTDIGLTPTHHVVAYDDEGGGWAGRFLWLLETVGHTQYSYLNGGIHAWLDDALPSTTVPAAPAPAHWHLGTLSPDTQVDLDYVLRRHTNPDVIIWDARSPEEFSGARAFALRGGHIPGAVNYEWTRALDPERGLRLKAADLLRRELADEGITAAHDVIVHCHTHHRSGLAWLAGRVLGFPRIRAYPGSWSEWGNHPGTPITTRQDQDTSV